MTKTIIVRHERPEWTRDYVERLTPMFPGMAFKPAYTLDEAMALAPAAEAIMGIGPQLPPALFAATTRLEWVQTLTTGIDNFLHMKELPEGVPVTNIVGVQGPQMSEATMALMLALARDLPGVLRAQAEARWDRRMQIALHGKTLCLLGLGSIAETLTVYARTFGMRVIGVSDGRREAPGVERIYPRAALAEAAGEADFLVVLVPLTPETRHIVDARVLAAMKPGGFLLNMARGGCVDPAALIEALEAGRIAGAALDVFERTPLPPDDPLWTAPNLIISPHVGGYADIYADQCLPTVIENLKIYAEQGPGGLRSVLPAR
ncbi:MAG: D-2-hydroxyacid dehydrogenase [Paracoccaceae bacterium]